MYRALVIRAGWISICLLTIATMSFSQPAPTAAPNPSPIQIIYTGKLMGYFRTPSPQSGEPLQRNARGELQRCPATPNDDSRAAKAFLEQRNKDSYKDAILVGTGDNFAPQLEARVFDPAPADPARKPAQYQPGNKELYFSDGQQWFFYKHNKDKDKEELQKRLAAGLGTIPTDNVGCFLASARFAAIVPGKHDFYFGAERLRMLARFMAGLDQSGYQPVQMLGANLVIKTAPINPQPARPDKKDDPWFKAEWPVDDYPVQNLSDGRSVYPWFPYVHIKFTEFKAKSTLPEALRKVFPSEQLIKEEDFIKLLDKVEKPAAPEDQKELDELKKKVQKFSQVPLYVCHAENDPNDIRIDDTCRLKKLVRISGSTLVYDVPLKDLPPGPKDPPRKDGHFMTLMHAQNYGLCLKRKEEQEKGDFKDVTYCLRFSVHTPFFYFPNPAPSKFADTEPLPGENNSYVDPDPFVLLEESKSRPYKVAIFGIVDPNLGEQVGILNFSWLRDDGRFKTVLSAEEPAEALKEQLEYFNAWYERRGLGQFQGLKILLAQMSPQRARVLAARLRDFQVVLAEADEEQGTSETRLSTVWSRETPAGAFVAVPLPYYDSKSSSQKLEGTVHFGMIKGTPRATSWTLRAMSLQPAKIDRTESPAATFWQRVVTIFPKCLPAGFDNQKPDNRSDQLKWLKWLTLCAMREKTGADVALLQKRDFFDQLPAEAGDAPGNAQQILDRIIWKGDLLTLLYVPGSALKKAFDLSKKFDDDDANLLSLSDERKRGLEFVGIKKVGKEYLINEAPLDEKKIYAVATSDYIGAGDTGYPDFAAAALAPKVRPEQFQERFRTISSVVCGALYQKAANTYCLDEIARNDYLDQTIAEAAPSYEAPGLGNKLWKLFPFKAPDKISALKKTADALDQKTQHRPIWLLSLKNFSLQFSNLSSNHSDADIDQKFSGIPTSGVTAHKTSTVIVGLDSRLSRSSHKRELFAAIGIDYKEQSTGVANTTPQVVQLTNRLTGDAGLVRNIWGGRSAIRWGGLFYLHAETALQRPFTTFNLGTQTIVDPANNTKVTDRLTISQDRGLLLLPRVGLRVQNRLNSFEIGLEAGREINALGGYRFTTQGSIDECLPNAAKSFASCIKSKSTPPNATITIDSEAKAILEDRPRAGMYWKINLSIPLNAKVKYELNQEADFFLVNFHRDTVTDTRYRDLSKSSLKFAIWPSFSIGPSLQLLLFRNKVNRDFLFQKQFGMEASFSFDLFNSREKGVQLKHKP